MRDLRGVVLAGGSGSRLYPLTKTTNKHLLPVGSKPMVYYPIESLVSAGILDILVVTGVHHFGALVAQLGSGAEFGCRFTYKVQDRAGGIAEALGLAEDFAHGGRVAVVLGDNVFDAPLRPHLDRWHESGKGAMILLARVPDPQRFGVPRFDGERIVEVVEKPPEPPSPFAVTGVYFYDSAIYDIIRTLRPSTRGELEISEVNTRYIARGQMHWAELGGRWTDAGTMESYARAQALGTRL
ncbi:MAG: NTP transferase domain-containing protein [Deltaproteobacteria bacterium]|nr:NTP transferase domain-containing protein [Deltaproteobacteria bacterium]